MMASDTLRYHSAFLARTQILKPRRRRPLRLLPPITRQLCKAYWIMIAKGMKSACTSSSSSNSNNSNNNNNNNNNSSSSNTAVSLKKTLKALLDHYNIIISTLRHPSSSRCSSTCKTCRYQCPCLLRRLMFMLTPRATPVPPLVALVLIQ